MKDLRGSQGKTVIKGDGNHDRMQTTDGQNIVTHAMVEQTKGASGKMSVTSTGSQNSKKESGHTTIHADGNVHYHGSHKKGSFQNKERLLFSLSFKILRSKIILTMIIYKSTPADYPIIDIQFIILPYQQNQTLQELHSLLVDFSEKMRLSNHRSIVEGNLITSIQGQIQQYEWMTFEHFIKYSNNIYSWKNNKEIYLNITGYFGNISDQNYEHLLQLL